MKSWPATIRLSLLSALLVGAAPAVAQTPPGAEPAPPCYPGVEACADQAPAAQTGPESAVDEDPAIEASAEEEFTPADEISEDYPVPLPSDI